MKAVARRIQFIAVMVLAGYIGGVAQEQVPGAANDPRVGLKPGLRNAATAARNLELIASVPKPRGFFDPKAPAGERTPAEKPDPPPTPPGAPKTVEPPGPVFTGLNYANSDMAFRGNQMFVGNFSGFNTYDISNPKAPKLIASVVCPGGQGDLSVHGNLLFMSVEQTRGRIDCGTGGVETPVSIGAVPWRSRLRYFERE